MSKKISVALALVSLFFLLAGTFLPQGHAQTAGVGPARNSAIVSTTAAILKDFPVYESAGPPLPRAAETPLGFETIVPTAMRTDIVMTEAPPPQNAPEMPPR